MKLNITNLYSWNTICPTQYNFDVVDHPIITDGYFRYRDGFLRLDLHSKKNGKYGSPERCYGIKCGEDNDGDIDFRYAFKILSSNMGVTLKWDGVIKSDFGDVV